MDHSSIERSSLTFSCNARGGGVAFVPFYIVQSKSNDELLLDYATGICVAMLDTSRKTAYGSVYECVRTSAIRKLGFRTASRGSLGKRSVLDVRTVSKQMAVLGG